MAIDLSAISNASTTALGLSNLILVTPNPTGYQPQNAPLKSGEVPELPPGFFFNYEGEQILTLKSDITDHYIEDNTAIQDQIALRPETFQTHGFIGELNDVVPPLLEPLKLIAEKLTVVSAYTPALTPAAIIAYNTAFQLYQTAQTLKNSAVSTWDTINGNGAAVQNKQQIAFAKFYGYWRSRTLFTIQTPWAIFQNMAIEQLRAIQGDETDVITDFEIQFKMLRFASTVVTPGGTMDSSEFQGRAATQSAKLVNLGTSKPVPGISLSQAMGVA